jgi:hypothetical protein
MNATVSSQVPLDRLQGIWDGLAPQVGSYKRTTSTETTSVNNIPIYVVHGEFEKALVDLRLAFDGTNQLSYFLVTPLSALPKRDIERMATGVASDSPLFPAAHRMEVRMQLAGRGFHQAARTKVLTKCVGSADELA